MANKTRPANLSATESGSGNQCIQYSVCALSILYSTQDHANEIAR